MKKKYFSELLWQENINYMELFGLWHNFELMIAPWAVSLKLTKPLSLCRQGAYKLMISSGKKSFLQLSSLPNWVMVYF